MEIQVSPNGWKLEPRRDNSNKFELTYEHGKNNVAINPNRDWWNRHEVGTKQGDSDLLDMNKIRTDVRGVELFPTEGNMTSWVEVSHEEYSKAFLISADLAREFYEKLKCFAAPYETIVDNEEYAGVIKASYRDWEKIGRAHV